MNKEETKVLKAQVLDHLNQIAILLENVDYQYGEEYNEKTHEWEVNPEFSPENNYLYAIKKVNRDLLFGARSNTLDDTLEYYTSSG